MAKLYHTKADGQTGIAARSFRVVPYSNKPEWRLPAGRQGIGKNMEYFVYALKSISKNYIYVGMTQNLSRRLEEHNKGWVSSTKFHRPFSVLYTKKASSRLDARLREKYLKSGSGKEFLRKLLEK